MGFVLGNAGVILLIISACAYIALIDSHWLINACTIIAAYLFCVLLDNMYSIAVDTLIHPIYPTADLQSSLIYLIYMISYTVLLACICPVLGQLLHLLIDKMYTGFSKQLLYLLRTHLIPHMDMIAKIIDQSAQLFHFIIIRRFVRPV